MTPNPERSRILAGGTPSPEPIAIEYKRWRNKRHGYEAIVLEVQHWQGEWGWHTRVVVQGNRWRKDSRISWPAKTFLRFFEPVGRKLKIPSRWDRLRKE